MGLDFDERPKRGNEYGDGWYHPGSLNSAEDSGTEKSTPSAEDLEAAENSSSVSGSQAESDESRAIEGDDTVGTGYSGSEDGAKTKKKGSFKKRGGIAGGITGIVIASMVGFTTLTGPPMMLNHLKETLLSKVSAIQMHQSRKYRQGKIGKVKNLFSREGRLSQSIISEMEGDGYKFSFDKSTKNMLGITPPRGTSSLIGTAVGDHIDEYMETKHPFRTARWKTKRTNALYKRYGVKRTSVVDKAKLKPGEDPSRTINREMADVAIDDNPKGLSTKPGQDDPKATDEQKKATIAENANASGVDADGETLKGSLSDEAKSLKAGDDISKITATELESGLDGVDSSVLGTDTLKTAENLSKGLSIRGKVLGTIKGFLNPLDLADKTCTIRNRLIQAQTAMRAAKAVKLIKYAGVFISAADSTRTGKADAKLINSLMKRVTAVDKNGNSIGGSIGFASMLKGKYSKSRNSVSSDKVSVSGKLNGVFGSISSKVNDIPGMSHCKIIQNPATQIAVGTADAAVTIVAGFFTGGAEPAAAEVSEEVAKTAVEQTFKDFIKESIKETITKDFAKDFAKAAFKGALADLSFDGIMTLTQMYVEKISTVPFTGQEKGAQLGDILTAGTGTMNKQRSLDGGMVPATTAEYASAQQEYIAWNKQQKSQESFATRVFDTSNPQSVAFGMLTTGMMIRTNGLANNMSSLVSTGLSFFNGNIFSSISSLWNVRAHADDGDLVATGSYTLANDSSISLATDFAGNPQMYMPDSISSIDTDSNIDSLIASGDIDPTTLEPISDSFKNHIENCVDTTDAYTTMEKNKQASDMDPANDCLALNPKTKQFKAHLAYLDMVDGLKAEFTPEDIQ